MSPDANTELLDAALRHQVGLRRLVAIEARKVVAELAKADRELAAQLRKKSLSAFSRRRLKALLVDVRAARALAIGDAAKGAEKRLVIFGDAEAKREMKLLLGASPVDVRFASVAVERVRALVVDSPFQGRTLSGWFNQLKKADARRVESAIRLGVQLGEPVPKIVTRLTGTRAAAFADGAMAISRRDAEAVVRTATNHVGNAAREAVWEENSDFIEALQWVSTLDGRTTPVCQARDGKVAAVGDRPLPKGADPLEPQSARPPAHFQCRSVMVAVLDGEGLLGDRPAVTDTRGRRDREVDFRRLAKDQGKTVKQVRAEWAAKNVGTVPAKVTYQEWLKRQPASFQDEVLGAKRASAFRSGTDLDEMVTRSGKLKKVK